MKLFSRLLLFALLLLAMLSCIGRPVGPVQEALSYSDSLIVLPNGFNIHYHKLEGTEQVTYNLKVNYPANEIIAEISKSLEKKGWHQLKYSFFEPTSLNSQFKGWDNYIDASKFPEREVHFWKCEWKNNEGNICLYAFIYMYPVNALPDLSSLIISCTYWPAAVAEETKRHIKMHENK